MDHGVSYGFQNNKMYHLNCYLNYHIIIQMQDQGFAHIKYVYVPTILKKSTVNVHKDLILLFDWIKINV